MPFQEETKPTRTELGLLFALFASIPLLFALYTGSIWEDYYITFRASKNLAMGHGLVFTEHQRIQSFTSPLGVLVPAFFSWLVGPAHDDAALWLFRLLSAGLIGAGGVFFYIGLRNQGISRGGLWALLTLMALDAKTALFASSGMETGFMFFFLSLSWYALTVERSIFASSPSLPLWKLLGLSWAGLMWSRPDGFVYGGGLALGFWAFEAGLAEVRGRRWLFRQFGKALLLAALLYLPWVLWAWDYYGNPIPHTIIAKGLHAGPIGDGLESLGWVGLIENPIFQGPYFYFKAWNPLFFFWGNFLWLITVAALFLPRVSRITRAASVAFLVAVFYLLAITPFCYPWYIPNGAWLGYLTLILLWNDLDRLPNFPPSLSLFSKRLTPFAWALLLPQLLLLGSVFHQMERHQQLIELGNRKPIGLWLRTHAETPQDTVFIQCLGYVGYFSNLKMIDFPGLASPEMVQARRAVGNRMAPLIDRLHPDWLVLRPNEIASIESEEPGMLSRSYQIEKVFDVSSLLEQTAVPIQGKNLLLFDAAFTVFHRLPDKTTPTPLNAS